MRFISKALVVWGRRDVYGPLREIPAARVYTCIRTAGDTEWIRIILIYARSALWALKTIPLQAAAITPRAAFLYAVRIRAQPYGSSPLRTLGHGVAPSVYRHVEEGNKRMEMEAKAMTEKAGGNTEAVAGIHARCVIARSWLEGLIGRNARGCDSGGSSNRYGCYLCCFNRLTWCG